MNSRILIVDDDPNLRRTLKDILHFKGFEPLTASGGREAVAIAARESPAVALIDLRLEDMPGLEVLRRIKEHNDAIACIVLTGHASQRTAIDAVNLGAYSYVQKPYDVDQLLLTIRRASEKREADEALRHSEALLRATGRMAKVGGWEIDLQDLKMTWTEELYAIHEVDEDYEPNVDEGLAFYTPEAQPVIRQAVEQAMEEGRPFDLELPFVTAQGNIIYVHVLGRAEYEDTEIVRVAGTFQDITDRKEAEKALRHTNRRLEEALAELHEAQEQMIRQERLAAVGQLSAGLAHEYNNLMATIILYADMMLRTSNLDSADRERLTAIYEQGRRAADLTQQILDFSRKAILRKKKTAVIPYLEDLEQRLRSMLPEKVKISIIPPQRPLYIEIDVERVRQALVNMALNARDAMAPQGGNLRIEADELSIRDGDATAPAPPIPELTAGDWIVLTVSDTGSGIASEILPHIWEPFFTTKAPMYSGLGLSQVLGIVKQHQGYIDVKSKVGEGTTFTIYLPAIREEEASPQAPTAHYSDDGDDRYMALVIEQNDLVRDALVAALESLNTTSVATESVTGALERDISPTDQVRLVLSDIANLTDSCVSLIRDLKRQYPNARVVITGDQIPNRDIRAMVRSGAIRWLEKPIDLAKLAEVVADIDFNR